MMKNRVYKLKAIGSFLALIMVLISCERDLSDDAVEAGFPTTGEIFTDNFVAMGSNFYFPFQGAKPDVFSVDNQVAYESNSSIRIDVPNANDPDGSFAGAIFRSDAGPRDLSGYDALTFWARATQGVAIGEMGFGVDFEGDRFRVARTNVSLSTAWQKIVIPIPDASKLTQERGMFWFSAGTQDTGGNAYTFWVDELQFEKLGTIAQPRPRILEGQDQVTSSFTGSDLPIGGLTQTLNSANGDITVTAAPAYFDFSSSDNSVATIDSSGIAMVNGPGTTVISASLAGIDAVGSLTINSLGNFTSAPVPTRDPSNVISVFSDAYNNVPVDYYNGFFTPDGQTTQGGAPPANFGGDNVITYTDLNFVGIGTFLNVPTVNASSMTHIHVDLQVRETIDPGDFIRLQLINNVGGNESSGSVTLSSNQLQENQWVGFDVPLANFTGLASRDQLGLIFFVSDSTISNLFVDNIYYYTVPTSPVVAAPTPVDSSSNVISLYSNAYTNVPVDTFRTPWSSAATTLTDEVIAGDDVKKYATLGFAGIETTSNTIDATGMTHFRIDTWSAGYTQFNIKLVDFGANEVFGGGDDTEHEVSITSPATGQWVSHDIPLSDFTGLVNRDNIAQYIIVAQPFEGTDVFVDNIYFRN